jgi:hypothetical protein
MAQKCSCSDLTIVYLAGNYCLPNCSEPWIEASFEDPAIGKVCGQPVKQLCHSLPVYCKTAKHSQSSCTAFRLGKIKVKPRTLIFFMACRCTNVQFVQA